MTSSLKKLLADCFKTSVDGPKSGLLVARAISNVEIYQRLVQGWGTSFTTMHELCIIAGGPQIN